jgi:hypothetical protein
MRNLFSAVTVAFVICIAAVSPPEKAAAAADSGAPVPPPPPGPSPAPTPAPSPNPGDCVTCAKCVAACGTTYADCLRRCFGQPDLPSQQACSAACQTPIECGKNCPCGGCAPPQLPH